ncbi:glutamyl-tRNA reductase [Tengunoibacter tsumagoiensis]|uniref:Glutamyl-tRNA reductase n=1 Tax=Tengunoibacter tsumagoiensis TaxID=2014871 RepID=A0A402A235_9CHLR|nr:glutamyl-tRNA reductase [Tengunoibacter tsumagoiensis]GCE13109.1 glutamyl-tRNA reductase [Tengunoibacter tsumagoiensis]
MHIIVVGVDHTTASIELRERLTCSSRHIPHLLQAASQYVQECVLLSTCNRLEIYAVCQEISQGRLDLLTVMSELRQVAFDEVEAHSYSFADERAIAHLFGVACGLFSLVPGEPQIQGQVAEAMEIAQGGGFAGPLISGLFRSALVTGKRARSETGISKNAASLSHVAVQLAHHLLPDLHQASVLLVGSGKMSELAARNLCDNGAQRLVIVNRTQAHAAELAQSFQGTHRTFAELSEALIEADVVISSTKSPRALMTYELMSHVMAHRGGRSLLMIDIALPRDIEPAVADLPGIHLYNLDDLQSEVERGILLRLQEAEQVRVIVAEEVAAFQRWQASLSVVDTISDFRKHVDALRQQELARTLRQLPSSLSEREVAVVQELTTRLMNKVLHTPMLRLKEAAAAGQGHVYAEAMRYLFDLEEKADVDVNKDRNTSKQARYDTDAVGNSAATPAVAQS